MSAPKTRGRSKTWVKRLVKLRDEGAAWKDVAEAMGTSISNAKNFYRQSRKDDGTVKEAPGPRPDPPKAPEDFGKLKVEGRDILTLSKENCAATVQEIKAMSGLGDDYYVADSEVGEYQLTYKLKNALTKPVIEGLVRRAKEGASVADLRVYLEGIELGHRTVPMYTTRVKMKPALPDIGKQALENWIKKNRGTPLPKKRWKKRDDKAEIAVNWGYYDTHIGMYSWAGETGKDWDVEIALTRVLNSVDEMVERLRMLPSIDEAYVPFGNDLGHFDGVRQTTAKGDHHMDVDTRFPRVFDAALSAMLYQVERLLEICNRVVIMWVPGNHDTSMSYGIFRAICMRFRDCPQVVVCQNQAERKYQYFHHCLLGFDHGKLKPEAYQSIIMNECRGRLDNVWYTEMNTGHTHEEKQTLIKTSVPTNGVQVRVHPSLCEPDSWHFGKGFLGAPMKSVEALYYTPEGRAGDFVVYASDDRKRNISAFITSTVGG